MRTAGAQLVSHVARMQYRQRDHVLRGHTPFSRLALVVNTAAVQAACDRWQLPPLGAALLGRTMTVATMLSSLLKGDEHVVVEFSGNGPLARLYAEAVQVSEIRGFGVHTGDLSSTSDVLGEGVVTVRRSPNTAQPLISSAPIQRGDVTRDVVHLLWHVDHNPSQMVLETHIDPATNKVLFSGGYLSQLLPSASTAHEQEWAQQEDAFEMATLREMLEEAKSDSSHVMHGVVAHQLIGEPVRTSLDYVCRCTSTNTQPQERAGLCVSNSSASSNCVFCNAPVHLRPSVVAN